MANIGREIEETTLIPESEPMYVPNDDPIKEEPVFNPNFAPVEPEKVPA